MSERDNKVAQRGAAVTQNSHSIDLHSCRALNLDAERNHPTFHSETDA